MNVRAYAILLAGLVWIPQPAGPAPTHELADVLHRAGTYVDAFHRQLAGIVSEETYLQEVVPVLGLNARGRERFQQRRLRSDLLLLRPDGAVTWVQFRDVFEVDGRPVRDREERLTSLVRTPGVPAVERVKRIMAESARYNIGRIERTMNLPLLPLIILLPENQSRFRFTIDRPDTSGTAGRSGNDRNSLPSTPHFSVGTEGWTLKFQEREGPTLIRTTDGRDLFSRGRFWIEPDSGRVLVSEMITEDARIRGELLVSYRSEPLLSFLVPVELRERYSDTDYAATITGVATYGNFRRLPPD